MEIPCKDLSANPLVEDVFDPLTNNSNEQGWHPEFVVYHLMFQLCFCMHSPNVAKALDLGVGLGTDIVIFELYDNEREAMLCGCMPVPLHLWIWRDSSRNNVDPPCFVIKNFIYVQESWGLLEAFIFEEICHRVGKSIHFHPVCCKFHGINVPTSINGIQKVSAWRIEELDGQNTFVAIQMVIQDPVSEICLHGLVLQWLCHH